MGVVNGGGGRSKWDGWRTVPLELDSFTGCELDRSAAVERTGLWLRALFKM